MFDFAVNTCKYSLDDTVHIFLDSGVAEQFGKGNPRYVVGRTGCELFWDCLRNLKMKKPPYPAVLYEDASPEFWLGWSVAYYQWLRKTTFADIFKKVPPKEILHLYWPLHEASERKFVEAMDRKCGKQKAPEKVPSPQR